MEMHGEILMNKNSKNYRDRAIVQQGKTLAFAGFATG